MKLCITPIVALTFAIFTMFRSYWINPFMNYVNHLPQDEIISIILYASIAFILGSSTQGIAGSSFSKKEKGVIPLIYCNCWLFIILSICTLFIWIPPIIGWPLLTFTPAWALLIYSVLPSFFPKEYKGRAITAFTFVLFLLIFVGGSLFGYLVDLFSLGISVKHAYQLTWGCFIILQLLAFVWAMSTRKKSYS